MKTILITSMILTFFCLSCKDKLKPLKRGYEIDLKTITVNANFCTLNPAISRSFLKFIYVIDKSTSNRTNPGTDPSASRRYDNLVNFVQNENSDNTVFYSLINFSNESNLVTDFITRNTFANLARNEKTLAHPLPPAFSNDDGWTNYGHAIDQVRELIVEDVNRSKAALSEIVSSHYIVFFLSDGFPTDENGNPLSQTDIDNILLPKIDNIASLASNPDNNFDKWVESIKFSTGYYYNTTVDATAQRILEDMAVRGNGDAFQFSNGEAVDYSKFTLPERFVKHSLKDVFLVNASTVWENDLLRYDHDADGLSDAKEIQLGSNPDIADSDYNGISDGIEYQVSGIPCAAKDCSPAEANPFHSCTSYIVPGWTPGDPNKYIDQDGDLLNNCAEKALLGSNIFKFDTNDDWISDFLALRSKGAISYLSNPKVSGRLLDPDSDGISNYHELKYFTPWDYNNSYVPERFKPYQYTLIQTAKEPSRTCYNLIVNPVMVYGDGNQIQLHIMEKSSIIDNRRFIRVIERTANGPELNIDIR